jgi:hypothetical protein
VQRLRELLHELRRRVGLPLLGHRRVLGRECEGTGGPAGHVDCNARGWK